MQRILEQLVVCCIRQDMSAKQEVESLLRKLPDSCSLEDIQYHLYVLEKIQRGLEDAREHGTISQAKSQLSI